MIHHPTVVNKGPARTEEPKNYLQLLSGFFFVHVSENGQFFTLPCYKRGDGDDDNDTKDDT